jgi:hypothetical protein
MRKVIVLNLKKRHRSMGPDQGPTENRLDLQVLGGGAIGGVARCRGVALAGKGRDALATAGAATRVTAFTALTAGPGTA